MTALEWKKNEYTARIQNRAKVCPACVVNRPHVKRTGVYRCFSEPQYVMMNRIRQGCWRSLYQALWNAQAQYYEDNPEEDEKYSIEPVME